MQIQGLTAERCLRYIEPQDNRMPLKKRPGSIDEYINSFPEHVQKKLTEIRSLVRKVAPEAQEKISYGMPTFYLNGNLVYFAAHSQHIGLYPSPTGVEKFKRELSRYKQGKGSVQFPLEEPLPVALIEKIVRYRVDQTTKKAGKQQPRHSSRL